MSDTEPICTVTYFTDGGRTENECGEVAEFTCSRCGIGRCSDHQNGDHSIAFFRLPDDCVVCDDCVRDSDEPPMVQCD